MSTGDDEPVEVFRRADGRPLDAHELTAYGRAGLAGAEAVRWADAGIGPYSAVGYRRAGLTLEEACRWRAVGISGDEAPTRPRTELDRLADELERRLAAFAEQIRTHSVRPSDLRLLLDAGIDPEQAVDWLAAGGPADPGWIRAGFEAGDAAAWHDAGIRRAAVEHWQAAGIDAPTARDWRRAKPDDVAAWIALGFDAKEAARWISKGLTPKQAAKARARGDHTEVMIALHTEPDAEPGGSTPAEPAFDPDLPFPAQQLATLKRPALEKILRDHFDVEPEADANVPRLRDQILDLQRKPRRRGVIRWAEYGQDETILYRPAAARWANRVVDLAASLETWGDVRRALRRRSNIVDPIRDHLRWQWESDPERLAGDVLDDAAWERIDTFEDLVAAMPPDASCVVELMADDGQPSIIDPMDPWTMGVPPLIIDQYYADHSNMVSHWTTVPVQHLGLVQRALKVLGFRLEQGHTGELPLF